VWLRECVYKRVTPKGKKAGFRSSMLTYLTSAVWHGVSPGYYLMFLLSGFATTVARLARSTIRPLVLPIDQDPAGHKGINSHSVRPSQPRVNLPKTLYDVAGTVCTVTVINFACVPFVLLYLPECIEAWRRLQWYGLWMIFGAMAFFYGGGVIWLKGLQAKRVGKPKVVTITATSSPNTPSVPPTVPPVDDILRKVEKKLS